METEAESHMYIYCMCLPEPCEGGLLLITIITPAHCTSTIDHIVFISAGTNGRTFKHSFVK